MESTNTELKKLIEWVHVNKLSLNIKKAKYMLFTLRKKPGSTDDIFIDHESIKKVEHFKFLGVIKTVMGWSYPIYKTENFQRTLYFMQG